MSITVSMDYLIVREPWHNIGSWEPRPLCKKDCGSIEGNKHIETAQRGPSRGRLTVGRQHHKQSELYMVPPDLISEIFNSILMSRNSTMT